METIKLYTVQESDWKLFKSRLPGWQESHMQKLCGEYAALLSGPGAPSSKFWALEKRIRNDKKSVGVTAEMSRSQMETNILLLLADGVIGLTDLEGFSKELQERMAFLVKNR